MRVRFAVVAALVLAFALFATKSARSAAPLLLTAEGGQEHLQPWTDVLEDPTGALTIADVTSQSYSARFRPLDRSTQGFSTSAFWLRLTLARAHGAPPGWVLILGSQSVADLYTPAADGDAGETGYVGKRSGTSLPFAARDLGDPLVAFLIQPALAPGTTYYMRVVSNDSLVLDGQAWPESAYASNTAAAKLEHGFYYGALFALVAYNFLLFAATRDRAYVLYAGFELAWILAQGAVDKYTFQLLWPGSPLWAFRSEQVFDCLTMAGAAAFARSFMSLDATAPRAGRLLASITIVGLIGAVLSMLIQHPAFVATVAGYMLASCVLLLLTTYVLAARAVPNARLTSAAWSLAAAGGIVATLSAAGVLQLRNFMLPMRIGALLEATLLSLGLASRVDVMRRQRHNAEAKVARAREQRLQALGRLVAGFAHEIGNPLNFALGGAAEVAVQVRAAEETLDREPASTDSVRLARQNLAAAQRAIGLVAEGTERIKRLLDNLRCYVRARDVEPVPTDVGAAVQSTLTLAAPIIQKTGARVTLRLSEIPSVSMRPGELEQVLTNLVVNACQAMTGGGELSIAVTASRDRARIELQDTGPGIPASRREAVFEPYFTTREESAERSGLGLYVSQDIASRHGGELRLEDSAIGAKFVLELPLAPRV
jgi:signal transduction histidine kinase